jgi:hypothetical protein
MTRRNCFGASLREGLPLRVIDTAHGTRSSYAEEFSLLSRAASELALISFLKLSYGISNLSATGFADRSCFISEVSVKSSSKFCNQVVVSCSYNSLCSDTGRVY